MCQYHPRDQWHHIYLYALSFSAQTLNLWRSKLGTIHLGRRQIFTIFDPYSPPVGSLLLQSIIKFGYFLYS